MPPDLRVTRIGRYVLPEPVPVTLLPPPQPDIFTRLWRWIFGGPKMTAPVVTAKFTSPGPFNPGDPLELQVSATGKNVTAVAFGVPVTVTDETTGETGTATAQGEMNMPSPLSAVVDDTTRTWAPGQASQQGQNFSQTFSSTA